MILLNPGPTNTSQTVKQALLVDDICPREEAFSRVLRGVERSLVRVAGSSQLAAVLFAGSGTAAVEATIASVVPPTGRLLILDNGAYGARMAAIARAYGIDHEHLEFGTGAELQPDLIASRLKKTRCTHLAVVHHETSTGILNSLEELSDLAREHGTPLIVDAMSSFGGIPIAHDRFDYLIASANKCLEGMPGLSFVIARRDELDALPVYPGRSLYLNLGEQHRYFSQHGQLRFTPPVQIVYALEQALRELEAEGGVTERHRRYCAYFSLLDAGMHKLGFRRLLPESHLSRVLTAYVEPTHPKYSFGELHDEMLARGFTIYPGKGTAQATFRLATMGQITAGDLRRFLAAMDDVITRAKIRPLYE